jgi:hypothetical protein
MFSIMKQPVIVGAILMSAVMALAQTQVQREILSPPPRSRDFHPRS